MPNTIANPTTVRYLEAANSTAANHRNITCRKDGSTWNAAMARKTVSKVDHNEGMEGRMEGRWPCYTVKSRGRMVISGRASAER